MSEISLIRHLLSQNSGPKKCFKTMLGPTFFPIPRYWPNHFCQALCCIAAPLVFVQVCRHWPSFLHAIITNGRQHHRSCHRRGFPFLSWIFAWKLLLSFLFLLFSSSFHVLPSGCCTEWCRDHMSQSSHACEYASGFSHFPCLAQEIFPPKAQTIFLNRQTGVMTKTIRASRIFFWPTF